MRVARDVLERFTDLPSDNRELRLLLDDVGLEVKRIDDSSGPLVFTLELLANRGDHHCYRGVAREITGRTGLPLRDVVVADLAIDPAGWPLINQTDDLLLYTATLLIRADAGPGLAAEVRRPLEAADLKSISAPVDATNLANLELGQPTHVFDADKVVGAIVIRSSTPGETAWPLFAEGPVELPTGTLVIADEQKVLAIAGVIGCEDSKATDDSRRILLESAAFDPVAVRKASRSLGIFTDSSVRFERGSDPGRVLIGAGRVVELLEQLGWQRDGGTSTVGSWTDPMRVVSLQCAAANSFLGCDLMPEEVVDVLSRYGFRCETDGDQVHAAVPTWRIWDVHYPADLYEELAKSIGYNNLPTSLPSVDMGAQPSPKERRKRTVEDVLIGAGFYECFTDGFYGRSERDLLGATEADALWAHVHTTNALDRGYGLLKNNCLAQAVLAVADNLNRREANLKLFEWTRTFHPTGTPTDRHHAPCTERPLLWGICCGVDLHSWSTNQRPADAIYLKGLVREIGIELGLELTLAAPDPKHLITPLLHPGRSAAITLDGETVGVLGEVHPALLQRARIKRARPCYVEIDQNALFAPGNRPFFREPPTEQPMDRNLAFSLPMGIEADAVAAWMHACGPDWLERVTILDLYAFEEQGHPMRAITYGLRFASGRSADEVNDTLTALVAAVLDQYGTAGVTQR